MLAFPVNSAANVTLFTLKQVLDEVKRSYHAWFGLLHPHSLLDTKGVVVALGAGDSTKVLHTDPSCWELIYSVLSEIFEKLGTSLEIAIKHVIELLPDSYHQLKGSTEYRLCNLTRLENCFMST